jgi:hypothetical protein
MRTEAMEFLEIARSSTPKPISYKVVVGGKVESRELPQPR